MPRRTLRGTFLLWRNPGRGVTALPGGAGSAALSILRGVKVPQKHLPCKDYLCVGKPPMAPLRGRGARITPGGACAAESIAPRIQNNEPALNKLSAGRQKKKAWRSIGLIYSGLCKKDGNDGTRTHEEGIVEVGDDIQSTQSCQRGSHEQLCPIGK